MNIKVFLHKRNAEQTAIERVVLQSAEVWYVKAMEKRLTTSDHTAQAVYVAYQLVWSVATQIGYGNLLALESWVRHTIK